MLPITTITKPVDALAADLDKKLDLNAQPPIQEDLPLIGLAKRVLLNKGTEEDVTYLTNLLDRFVKEILTKEPKTTIFPYPRGVVKCMSLIAEKLISQKELSLKFPKLLSIVLPHDTSLKQIELYNLLEQAKTDQNFYEVEVDGQLEPTTVLLPAHIINLENTVLFQDKLCKSSFGSEAITNYFRYLLTESPPLQKSPAFHSTLHLLTEFDPNSLPKAMSVSDLPPEDIQTVLYQLIESPERRVLYTSLYQIKDKTQDEENALTGMTAAIIDHINRGKSFHEAGIPLEYQEDFLREHFSQLTIPLKFQFRELMGTDLFGCISINGPTKEIFLSPAERAKTSYDDLLKQLPKLDKLGDEIFLYCIGHTPNNHIRAILKKYPDLSELHVDCCDATEEPFKDLPKLERIKKIELRSSISNQGLRELLKNCPHVEEFSKAWGFRISNTREAFKDLPLLEDIKKIELESLLQN